MNKNIFTSSSLILLVFSNLVESSAQKFDPYQLNGGLVAAVAGKDYVLIASDTRLTDGGYGINSRRYLSGRIWGASSSSWEPISTLASTQLPQSSSPSAASASWNVSPAKWESDGSLAMPLEEENGPKRNEHESRSLSFPWLHFIHPPSEAPKNSPVFIGSAGCASDCESLKRRFRLELDSLECNFPSGLKLGVQSIANLLQQVLYGRRGFPFYSFCVVAGMDNRDSDGSTGAVYVYDAIGSFERVAVGCSGTGRELLQPILDRLFSESSRNENHNHDECDIPVAAHRDVMSVPAGEQRLGVAGSLRPPVKSFVDCSWEEAVTNIARGYQSVAEREISVGDEIVICLLKSESDVNNSPTLHVISFNLKKD
ncbi:hypothetical protein HJC23_002168 [Cyclotella cryptica]|uniref:Uncharacterized protein n=1 Tax=Cyclotella cryptica TaxID=29204 RepID=A0ABD3Q676_9STRA|eukprot:CCRYP_008200-RA/>CCRYP_008200-RA protein AED:0.03 eAED:0.03 QI:200/1/1/1/1/1/2/1114/369